MWAAAQRRLAALKNDLDHESHECEIGRKRAVQSDCEQMVLCPALREAAGAMMAQSGPRPLDAHAKEELRAARAHILNDLEQLEGRCPILQPRKSVAFATILIYPPKVGSGRR